MRQLYSALLIILVGVSITACNHKPPKAKVQTVPKLSYMMYTEANNSPDATLFWASVPATDALSWKEVSAGSMAIAAFDIYTFGRQWASVTVTSLPDTRPNVLANVNRWRRQINLPPVSNPSLFLGQFLNPNGLMMQTVRLESANGFIYVAMFPLGTKTWYLKFQSASPRVPKETIESFEQFLYDVQST